MKFSRRHILRTTALAAPALALAGCASLFTTTTVAGVTTLTINLTTLAQYATALKNGVATLFSVPAITAALGAATVDLTTTIVDDIATQVAALSAADKGSTSLVFTTTSVPAALTAFQTDAVNIAKNTATVFTTIGSTVGADILTTVDAFNTILALAEAVLPTSAAVIGLEAPAQPKLPTAVALAILGVTS
jgi:hypothetical protein